MKDYYFSLAPPVLVLFLVGFIWLGLFGRRSAASRQFTCASVFVAVFLIGLVPFLPGSFRPILPISFPKPEAVLPEASGYDFLPSNVPQRPDYLLLGAIAIAVVSLLLLVRLTCSLLAGAQMRKCATPASSRLSGFTNREVRVVPSLSSPIAIGGFKPIILLPAAAEDWPEDQLRAVLIHEEAHLKNGDPNWQLLAEIVCLCHWFNPLVWMLRGVMRREAEKAADDAVVRAGISPSAYAEALVAFARQMGQNRHSFAWTAFAAKNGIHTRVEAILTPNIERKPMKQTMKITALVSAILTTYVASAFALPNSEAADTVKKPAAPTKQEAKARSEETLLLVTPTVVTDAASEIPVAESRKSVKKVRAGKRSLAKNTVQNQKSYPVVFRVSQVEYEAAKKKDETKLYYIVDLVYEKKAAKSEPPQQKESATVTYRVALPTKG